MFELVHGRSSRCVIIHDRGIWKLGEYLCGETAGYVRVILRDRCELKANQRFAFGTKLEQKGFAGAVDIIKVCNKEDFCTVPNYSPKTRRLCQTPGLRPVQLGLRERIYFRIRWCCDQREGDVVGYRNMRTAGRSSSSPKLKKRGPKPSPCAMPVIRQYFRHEPRCRNPPAP